MKLFKKNNHIVDERIENIKNKIYKEISILVMLVCTISIIVKYSMYGQNIKLVATELLIMFSTSVYYVVRIVYLGIYSDEVEMHDRTSKISMNTKNIIIGLVIGISIAIFFGFRSALLYGTTPSIRVQYFSIVFIVSILIYLPFFIIFLTFQHSIANKISKKQSLKRIN
ncbi:DUF6773 family protein [Clostridium tetani]|uniref:TRAP transporter small permease n=1 Tax=Clostridium tetani TaxID=1513 RepID=A0ABY0ELB8_CLOTA|nr:DUF6773 family protein [Clostridium tetani]CDI49487.1 hypothetical protein BN906_01489 [Clostridium tetani 12124569]KHO39254.1 hypothetical protein OR62_07150 [Clostridium tetani]RXI37668.1 hypothetical protein DP129_12795 [Clostridium tetani]RXI49786.1 hypothetical protein DP124_12290 [Clostridium tetani]RXI50931.1 hypothetical protein DP122_12600 [Clostridium tetani]